MALVINSLSMVSTHFRELPNFIFKYFSSLWNVFTWGCLGQTNFFQTAQILCKVGHFYLVLGRTKFRSYTWCVWHLIISFMSPRDPLGHHIKPNVTFDVIVVMHGFRRLKNRIADLSGKETQPHIIYAIHKIMIYRQLKCVFGNHPFQYSQLGLFSKSRWPSQISMSPNGLPKRSVKGAFAIPDFWSR